MDELLIEFLKENYKFKLAEISTAIGLINMTLEDVLKELKLEMEKDLDSGNYNEMEKKTKYHKLINKEIHTNDKLIEEIDSYDEEDILLEEEIMDDKDYEKYVVDEKIPHTLYEDLTHTRPHGFKIDNSYIRVDTWKDFLLELSSYLYKKDSKKFESLTWDKDFKGRKKRYFSKELENFSGSSEPRLIKSTDIYVETLMSANSIKSIVIKMLKKFDIKIVDVPLYFRADYSEKTR